MRLTMAVLRDDDQQRALLQCAEAATHECGANGTLWIDLFHRALLPENNTDLAATLLNMRFAQQVVWEQLHQGLWYQVNAAWRTAYHCTNIAVAAALYETSTHVRRAQMALYELDMALIMGGPLTATSLNVDQMIASLINDIRDAPQAVGARPTKRRRITSSTSKSTSCCCHVNVTTLPSATMTALPVFAMEIARGDLLVSKVARLVQPPSMSTFKRDIFDCRCPHIIEGVVNQWPAYAKWDIDYLLHVAGPRTVPIEIGRNYMSKEWTQKLMTLDKFIKTYMHAEYPVHEDEAIPTYDGDADTRCGNLPRNTTKDTTYQHQHEHQHHYGSSTQPQIAYLAQHELFDQIPELSRDIVEPDYCIFSDHSNGLMPQVQRNSWFGPRGTVSPLHYDRYHNLFCQVFGSKTILLIDPAHSACLYPNDGIQCNTSQVDFENENWMERWPKTKHTPCQVVRVHHGEMLYIPPGWWHFCVAEETSFSVSYWWSASS